MEKWFCITMDELILIDGKAPTINDRHEQKKTFRKCSATSNHLLGKQMVCVACFLYTICEIVNTCLTSIIMSFGTIVYEKTINK